MHLDFKRLPIVRVHNNVHGSRLLWIGKPCYDGLPTVKKQQLRVELPMLKLLPAIAFKFKTLLQGSLFSILHRRLMQDFTDVTIFGGGQDNSFLRLILFLCIFHEDLATEELSQRLLVDPVWPGLEHFRNGSLSVH